MHGDAQATRAIILACVLVELALSVGGPGFSDLIALGGGLIPARISGAVVLDHALPAPFTLVTTMFLHAGWLHLGFNMVFLLFVGRFVEALLGPVRFLVLFMASGIAGSLVQVALDPASVLPVVGASGAISGVFAAHAMIFGRTGERSEAVRALQLAGVWIGLQVASGLVINSDGGGIAIGAHIGGFLAGLLLALPLARRAIGRQ